MAEQSFIEMVEQVLNDVSIEPDCLRLEITESMVMDDPDAMIAKLKTTP